MVLLVSIYIRLLSTHSETGEYHKAQTSHSEISQMTTTTLRRPKCSIINLFIFIFPCPLHAIAFKSYNQFLIIKCKVLGYLVHIRGGWINSSHFGVCLNHQLAVWSSCGVFPFTRLTRIVNINKRNSLEQWPHGSTLCPFPSSLKISWFKRVSLNNWLGS